MFLLCMNKIFSINFNEFIRELSPVLNLLEKNKSEVTLSDDFNLDLIKRNDKQIISDYCYILNNHSFIRKLLFLPDSQTNMVP